MAVPYAPAASSMTALPVQLSEDEVDDVLYFARTNSLNDLQDLVAALSTTHSASADLILVSAKDEHTGNTAAHYASANGLLDVAKYIASNSASASGGACTGIGSTNLLRQPNEAGNTPLHYAALNGHIDIVKFLLESTSDEKEKEEYVALKNNAGKDAVYEAEMAERTEIVGLLLSAVGLGAEEATTEAAAAANGIDADTDEEHPDVDSESEPNGSSGEQIAD